MGHAAKIGGLRCDILDELEAAVVYRRDIRVYLDDGAHRAGRAKDVYTKNHEDFLQLESHLPIPVSLIVRVERI